MCSSRARCRPLQPEVRMPLQRTTADERSAGVPGISPLPLGGAVGIKGYEVGGAVGIQGPRRPPFPVSPPPHGTEGRESSGLPGRLVGAFSTEGGTTSAHMVLWRQTDVRTIQDPAPALAHRAAR